MIKEFADKTTAAIFAGIQVRRIPKTLQVKAQQKLEQINAASKLEDLRNPPSNRLEKKSGDMRHLYCLRVNKQWRVCFQWKDGDAYKVHFIDYH